ncbi:MAG: glycoside hydrolase [Gammaproteobacteria bacterium]|nr:glycoside hydrolase [Gammaproteobacteria bacterium]
MNRFFLILLLISIFISYKVFLGDSVSNSEKIWKQLPSPDRATVNALSESSADRLYAGTDAGLYVLDKGAGHWVLISSPDLNVSSVLAVRKSTILVGTYRKGLWRSADEGKSWSQIDFESNVYIDGMTRHANGSIFVAVAGSVKDQQSGIFRSDDDGLSWFTSGLTGKQVHSVTSLSKTTLFAGTRSGTFRSDDSGTNWSFVKGLPDNVTLSSIIQTEKKLIAGFNYPRYRAPGAGVWVSMDDGETWEQMSGLPQSTSVHTLAALHGKLFAATGDVFERGGAGVYISNDYQHWEHFALERQWLTTMLTSSDGMLYVGSVLEGVYSGHPEHSQKWTAKSTGLRNWFAAALAVNKDSNFYALDERSLMRYDSLSSNWINLELPPEFAPPSPFNFTILSDGTLVLPGQGSILMRGDSSNIWTVQKIADTTAPTNSIHVDAKEHLYVTLDKQGTYVSENRGNSWTKLDVSEDATGVLAPGNSTLISYGRGVSVKTENGEWLNDTLNGSKVFSAVECSGNLYLASAPKGVLMSHDKGKTWLPMMEPMRTQAQQSGYIAVHTIQCLPNGEIIAATFSDGLYHLPNNGEWVNITGNLPVNMIGDITSESNGKVYISTTTGVYERVIN